MNLDDYIVARQLNEQARQIQRAGEMDRARRYLNAAHSIAPEFALTRFNLAMWDYLNGDVSSAKPALEQLAIESDLPSIRADSLLILGNIAFDTCDLDKAYAYYSEVEDITTEDADPEESERILGDSIAGQGMVEKKRGNLARALELLESACRMSPKNVFAFTHLAHCYDLLKRPEDAVTAGRWALDLALQDPANEPISEMWMRLGGYYEEAERTSEARECYQNALELGEESAREILEELSGAE